MKRSLVTVLLALFGVLGPTLSRVTLAAPPAEVVNRFEERAVKVAFKPGAEHLAKYRLLVPKDRKDGQKYPLVIFLHGAGERGSDNANQLQYLPDWLSTDEMRAKFPCYLLAPQCPGDMQWVNVPWGDKESTPIGEPSDPMRAAMAMIDQVLKTEPIDTSRVYLTGLSMGGYGTWDLAMRRPTLFAAVAPICGGGDEREAARLKDIPIWAWHGDKDGAVPVVRTRTMIEAIRKLGGEPKYTEVAGAGHNVWTPAYTNADGVIPWLFAQHKTVEAKGASGLSGAAGIVGAVAQAADSKDAPVKAGQHAASFTPADGSFTLHYWAHIPEGFDKQKKWPVIVFLHGSGERGKPDGSDLARVKVHGPPKNVEKDKAFPFIVISPQAHAGKWWDAKQVMALIDHALEVYPCDRDRVYLTGLSMGGFGSWSMAVTYPDRFAAVVPICGRGDPSKACEMKNVPVWAFHGEADTAVNVRGSIDMIEALKKCDGGIEPKLTIYPGVGHDSWTRTYANPDLYKWLMSHKLGEAKK